jgi:hypothetical protein
VAEGWRKLDHEISQSARWIFLVARAESTDAGRDGAYTANRDPPDRRMMITLIGIVITGQSEATSLFGQSLVVGLSVLLSA